MPLLISPQEAQRLVEEEHAVFIDVRDLEEYEAVHIESARLHPLSVLPLLPEDEDKERPAIYFCQSGRRTGASRDLLEKRGHTATYVLDGGLSAWESAGLPVKRRQVPLPVMRQVHVAAGGLVLLSVLLGQLWGGFYAVAAFVGAGLAFSGLTGWCGMRMLLAKMPWNKRR